MWWGCTVRTKLSNNLNLNLFFQKKQFKTAGGNRNYFCSIFASWSACSWQKGWSFGQDQPFKLPKFQELDLNIRNLDPGVIASMNNGMPNLEEPYYLWLSVVDSATIYSTRELQLWWVWQFSVYFRKLT